MVGHKYTQLLNDCKTTMHLILMHEPHVVTTVLSTFFLRVNEDPITCLRRRLFGCFAHLIILFDL